MAPSTQPCDLMINAGWIIPVVPEKAIFKNCSISVAKGKIIEILPTSEAQKKYNATNTVDLPQHILMPGLINAHGHSAMSLLRGLADDLPLHTWLNDHIWPTEGKFVSAEFVHDGAELAIAEMIRSGTTCFSDMYFFPEETAKAAHDAGIRCQLAFPVLEFPSAWAKDANEYINKGLAVRDTYRSHSLITAVFGPHAPYTVSDETFERIATLAPELQANIHVHLHETAQEVKDSIKQYGKRPIQRLFDLNVLTPLTQCVHMTTLNEEDIALIKQSGASVIHCPESNLKLASGFCPIQKLKENDVTVALGTDGCASNNDLDMFGELHTATLLGKGIAQNAAAVPAHEALAMATINGAKSMGIDDVTGSLEAGKAADMIAIGMSELEQAPIYDPISTLVYTNISHRVTHNWVAGKTLMAERKLTTVNPKEIRATTEKWQKLISKR